MKKQLNQLRRFFARTGTRKLNAATAREVIPASYEDDDGSNRLSGAFVVVLLLHVVALVGVFAFSRMKDSKPVAEAAPSAPTASTAIPAPSIPTSHPATNTLPDPTPELPPVASDAANARAAALAATENAMVNDRIGSNARHTAQTAPTGSRAHVVKAGENLTKIAVAYGVRSADIKTANNLKSDELKPGQELVIPKAGSTASDSKLPERPEKPATTVAKNSYTVRKGDNLIKIARELGVKYEALAKENNIQDPSKLREGQTLKVPHKG